MSEPAGNPWSTALPDWKARIRGRRPLVPTLPLFDAEAQRALRVFRRLRIPDVHGQPTMATACGEWFFPIVAALFGSYDPETHRRMIQEFFLLVPKKNAKSSNGGAVMLTAAIMNRRPEAEFNFIAPTMQIASIAYKQAANTIKIDPELDKLFQRRDHIRTIQHRVNGTILQIKAADTDVVTGGKPVGTMIDETHEFARKSKAADIFLELRGALAARPDGFLFQTTTQSKDEPAGVFKAELAMARAVRDGAMDLPLLPVLYEYPEEEVESDAWRDPASWSIVNPNFGRSVDAGFLDREMRKAVATGAEAVTLFASQHLNVEIGLRLRSDRWRGADFWEQAVEPGLDLDALLARSEVVVAGIDGGGLDDLLGLALIGRCRETKRWLLWARAWCHVGVLDLRKEIAPKLRDLEAAGDLVIRDDFGTDDMEAVAELVAQVRDAGLLPEKGAVGVDSAGISPIVDALAAKDITAESGQLVAVFQGYKLNDAVIGMPRKLADGSMRHGGQPLMAWSVGNAKAERKGNAVLVTKQAAGTAKIDPLMAAFNAYMLMVRNPVAAGNTISVFEELARRRALEAAA